VYKLGLDNLLNSYEIKNWFIYCSKKMEIIEKLPDDIIVHNTQKYLKIQVTWW